MDRYGYWNKILHVNLSDRTTWIEEPGDLFFREGKRGLTLYVKRILILEECEDLLPSYLRFLRDVVDAADLPLNVSRELLQVKRQPAQIRRSSL